MKRVIAVVIILAVMVTAPCWADPPSSDLGAPEGATPAEQLVVTQPQPAPAPPAADQPVPPAPRAVRTTTPPPTHPPVVDGHHPGVGHKPVYQEMKKWSPASTSFVEVRDQKLGKEIRAELKSESAQRISADEKLSSRIQPLEEKGKDNWDLVTIITVLFILGITAVIGVTYSN